MIVYVPGRMPHHVGPYGAARYPGTLLGSGSNYYNPSFDYVGSVHLAGSRLFSGQLNLYQSALDLPIWPRRMPADEELGRSPGIFNDLATLPSFASGGPPSPAHSDSDASNSSLELSNIRKGENGQLKCRWLNCGKWFTSMEQLSDHVARLHAAAGRDKLFYCGWEGCSRGDRGFNARYKMLVHVRTHTNEKPHHCLECDKSFSRAENLKIHARSHTGERPYVCTVEGCGKRYSNSSDRFKHTRTHAVDKPYCCKVPGCPKRYTDPSSLRKHVKTYRHYTNNNNKVQQKSFDENNSSQESNFEISPDGRSNGELDKKDSSTGSITTTSPSLSPRGSLSFEEQRKFEEWNNMYNLQERDDHEHVKLNRNYHYEMKSYPSIFQEGIRTPEPRSNLLFSSHEIDDRSTSESPNRSPSHIPRIHMQSTPIKIEDDCRSKVIVDYRNIESIVNSTPNKEENAMRHSVIRRVDNCVQMNTSESPKHEDRKEPCCCRHTCCIHNNLSEKTKFLSNLIMKTQNPLFKQLLGSIDLKYEVQNVWTDVDVDEEMGPNFKVKSQGMTEMEQDIPLDLTIHK
ncbi:pH-response transcription factor pacC/RIM101 [Fopius arisanus]|uniref:Glis2 protein n=1 Tax=Fopius arisanus TaxID=64838 RepID=A0A0C9S196_9HYME|nr:PREDICTED: pH-response transcription factor pacC/RIM101-like [Fopius arisanus]